MKVTYNKIKKIMEKIHQEKGYSVAPSSEYDYVGMDLRDYYSKGTPLTYNDHSSQAVEFSRDVQAFIRKESRRKSRLNKQKVRKKRQSRKKRSKRH
jgi:hypothetical protein